MADPRIAALLEESETLLIGPGGLLLPVYPLFVAPDDWVSGGPIEPVLSFDGHGEQTAWCIGVRGGVERWDILNHLRDRVRDRDFGLGFTMADWSEQGVTEWARRNTLGVLQNLRGLEYVPELYQERLAAIGDSASPTYEYPEVFLEEVDPGPDDAVMHWLEHGRESALIVAGEAGMGKTSLFCRLAERLLAPVRGSIVGDGREGKASADHGRTPPRDCVLLLPGDGWHRGATLFERIREALGFRKDPPDSQFSRFEELLTAWLMERQRSGPESGKSRLLIFVDGLNELADVSHRFDEFVALAEAAGVANQRAAGAWVRLLVSMSVDDVEVLSDREHERRDVRLVKALRHFATFRDLHRRPVPYLALRPFASHEAGSAYARVQAGAGPYCAAPWERLSPTTRELLRHPMMSRLFHQAFARNELPEDVGSAETLWDAWFTRSFAPIRDGAGLEHEVLDLAEACIEGGHDRIPLELVEARRLRWQRETEGDPLRIAAGIPPLERLTEAGLVRRLEAGRLDWGSDLLAEQVLFRALRRRDPNLTEASFASWLARPARPRLDGALIRVGAEIWRSGRPLAVRPILDVPSGRGETLLGGLLLAVVPRQTAEAGGGAVPAFVRRLRALVGTCLSDPEPERANRLKNGLLRELRSRLENRSGHPRARAAMAHSALALAEHLSAMEPWNRHREREVSIALDRLGDLVRFSDRAKARAWYEKGLAIRERLVEGNPDNLEYQHELSRAYARLGELHEFDDWDQARTWYERAFAISRRLADQVPDTIAYQREISMTCLGLAFAAPRSDPAVQRMWWEELLAFQQRLADQDPADARLQRKLVVVLEQIGKLDQASDAARAKAAYEQALAIRRRLVDGVSDSLHDQRDLAKLLETLGQLEKGRAPAKARHYYLQAVAIRRSLRDRWPDNIEYQRTLSQVCERIGDIDYHTGRSDARRWYEEVLAIRQDLAKRGPDRPQFQHDLSCSYNRLGDLCRPNDPDQARVWYEKMLEITLRLLELEPGCQTHRYELWVCFNRFCSLEDTGDRVSAIRERLLVLSSPLDPDDAVDASTRSFLSDPGWIHVMGELDPPRLGIREALTWLERRHYPPRTERNDLFQMHVLSWLRIRWVIASIPLMERSLIELAAEQSGLRLLPGVPVRPSSSGLHRFPFGGATFFTLVTGPGHPSFRLQPDAHRALASQERETLRQIVDRGDDRKMDS